MRMTKNALLGGVAAVFAAAISIVGTAHSQELVPTESSNPIYAGVAASVNDEPITIADVANRARLILLSLGVAPNEETIVQAQQRALESLIDEKLQLQEAAQWELEVADEEIESELTRLANGNGMTYDQFRADLMNQSINPSTLRQQMKADLAWQRLVGGRYGSRVRVSDLQITDRLDRLEKTLNQEQLRVAEIFLPAYTQEQMSQMLQGAWTLRQQIEQGAPFGLVARQFSAAPTASEGGELGWLTKDQLKEELAEAVTGLSAPAISEPVVTEDGVYLVSLMDRREPVERVLAGFTLAQYEASGPDAAQNLETAAQNFDGCEGFVESADELDGVEAVVLGNLPLAMTSLVYSDTFQNTPEGELTDTVQLNDGRMAKIAVCEYIMSGAQLPTRDDIESTLREQQISLIADRYLRDLRRSATILRR